MKIEPMPVMTMAKKMELRCSKGKFFVRFTALQSSVRREKTRRTGMVRRLL